MALTNCPECQAYISDTALKCPKCAVQIRKPIRGIFGELFKWTFIGFNILMGFWLFSYWAELDGMVNGTGSDAEAVGAAIGGTIGSGMILTFWVFRDIILGLFVLFTRPKS